MSQPPFRSKMMVLNHWTSVITAQILFLLPVSLLMAGSAWANTPVAWTTGKINPVSSDEMQAYFGPSVFSAESDLNWSIQTEPTEIGKGLTFNKPWFYYALPACVSPKSLGCISKVEYRRAGENWESAKLSSRELRSRKGETGPNGRNANGVISTREFNVWPENEALHLPAGGQAAFWKFAKATHGGGDEYLVRVNIAGLRSAEATASNGKVQRYLEMNVFPYDGITEYEFPSNIEIKVGLKLGNVAGDLWGWFDGRIDNPSVILDTKSKDGAFEISGSPSRIPIGLTPKLKLADVSDAIKSLFTCPVGLPQSMCPQVGGLKGFSTEGNAEIANFTLFEKGLGKSSTIAYRTEWGIKTTRWPDVANAESCPAVKDGFVGIVTTNSSMYSPAAPSWNEREASFEFQVASPHLALDGSTNKGFYSLILPRDLAECRWGKEIENAKIVVSIVNSEGTSNITSATHTLTKDLLTFKISGFTFSTPTVRVGLRSPAKISPEVSPSPVTPNKVQNPNVDVKEKKITIRCQSSTSKVKSITAVNPKCPKGFTKVKKN